MSAHPEMVELLAAACGREVGAREHAAGCVECADTLELFSGVQNAVGLDAELDAEFEDLDLREFRYIDRGPAAQARQRVEDVLEAAFENPDGLRDAISALRHDRNFAFVLLQLCQRATATLTKKPVAGLALARTIAEEAGHLTSRVEQLRVEAESEVVGGYALTCLGQMEEASQSFSSARRRLAQLPADDFALAVLDYFEGNACGFERKYERAADLLAKSRRVFAAYGQDHWVARARSAEATLASQRGNFELSLVLFDESLRGLDPSLDSAAFVATLVNKATSLSYLGRLAEARAAYARALSVALKNRLEYSLHVIRNGLAEIDFRRGDLNRALTSFRRLAARALQAGYREDYAFAQLYVAECLGRLGRITEMASIVKSLQRERGHSPFDGSPAFEDLFSCLDQGELDADLIAYVREYLEEASEGRRIPYTPFRARA
jgi:tetratricopeptide (TPR) repeat protein